MKTIIRITNSHALRSPDPRDRTFNLADATHQYLYIAEYQVLENGLWEESRAWAGAFSVDQLLRLLSDAGLLREIAPPKHSGGE